LQQSKKESANGNHRSNASSNRDRNAVDVSNRADVLRTIKGNNPTCIFLVACFEGKPVTFAPLVCQMHLCHLAFSPDARASEKLKAVSGLLDFAMGLAVQFGIREITTMSRSSYPMGKVAEHLGFEKDSRELFWFDINKVLNSAAQENAAALSNAAQNEEN
jgi:hypothetical protein